MQEDNSSFSLLLDLLSELYQKQPKIGYHLLYYLRARWVRSLSSAWSWGTPESQPLTHMHTNALLVICSSTVFGLYVFGAEG
jgi:hypothetical protein